MLRTGLLPTLLTLALYTLLSFRHPITGLDEAVLSALTEHFSMSWLCSARASARPLRGRRLPVPSNMPEYSPVSSTIT